MRTDSFRQIMHCSNCGIIACFSRLSGRSSLKTAGGAASLRTVSHKAVSKLLIVAALVLLFSFCPAVRTVYAASASATGIISAGDYASLRKSPTVDSKELKKLDKGTEVVIKKEVFKSRTSTKKTSRWYYVAVNGLKGYVRSDLVKNIRYSTVSGTVTEKTAYRSGAGTAMKKKGSLKKGDTVTVCLIAKPVSSTSGSSPKWYRIKLGSKYYFASSAEIETGKRAVLEDNSVNDTDADAKKDAAADASEQGGQEGSNPFVNMSDSEFNEYLKAQGFPKAYRTKLKALHKKHPNWQFRAFDTGMKWTDAVSRIAKSAQIESGASMKGSSYTSSLWPDEEDAESVIYETASGEIELGDSDDINDYYREFADAYSDPQAAENAWMSGSGLVLIESAEIGSWVKASKNTSAFFMDPRNFLTENRIYMFEDLSYDPDYQTKKAVAKILEPTKLPDCGFTAKLFVNAGKKYNVSPVHLASRARQESGGGGVSVNGSQGVYNPFNIGAYSSASQGISYAINKGWTTPKKAVYGGAAFIAKGYIGNGQNTIYFQRFDVTNGLSRVGTHVYMTNIRAPYFEATSTKTAYKSYGITKEALTFIIPIYKNMPASTEL